jgi:hypothetical protein
MGFNATNLEYRAGAASAATSGGVTGLNKLFLVVVKWNTQSQEPLI